MIKHQPKAPNKLFAETPMGIVTRFGDWFHTTSEQIEEYAPGLLEEVDLQELVRAAQAWVKSADSLSMILLLMLLFIMNPFLAAAVVVVFHVGWYFNKSSFVAISLNKFFDLLYQDGTQLVVSLVVLSILGLQGYYLAGGVGLFFFFILKLGLLKKAWDFVYQKVGDSPLTLNDRVMKMIIIKYAIYENVAPSEIEEMEQQIKELALNRQKKS